MNNKNNKKGIPKNFEDPQNQGDKKREKEQTDMFRC